MRAPRFDNLLQTWSIPSAFDKERYPYLEFPELKADQETEERVEWWNKEMVVRANNESLKVAAGAEHTLVLNTPPRWFSWLNPF